MFLLELVTKSDLRISFLQLIYVVKVTTYVEWLNTEETKYLGSPWVPRPGLSSFSY